MSQSLSLGENERCQERGKGAYKRSEEAEVRQAARPASTRPPAPLRILVLHVFDSTPSEGLPAQNERVQVEPWPQRWPSFMVRLLLRLGFCFGAISCAANVCIRLNGKLVLGGRASQLATGIYEKE
jgi:hypothetical protein